MSLSKVLVPAQPIAKRGFITKACNLKPVLWIGRLLRLRAIGDYSLNWLPVWISDKNRVKRKVDSIEAIFMGDEIWVKPIYARIQPWLPHIRSFIDLGMNRGYFALYLYSSTLQYRKKDQPLFGLGIEPNPKMARLAHLNFQANHWDSIHVFQGVAGATEEVDFYVNPEDGNSSIFEIDSFGRPQHHLEILRVPPICVSATWTRLFDRNPCDLLKIDIEGAEHLFLDLEADFVRTVNYLIVEYHGAHTSRDALEGRLELLGFEIIAHEPNTETIGVLFAQSRRLREKAKPVEENSRYSLA